MIEWFNNADASTKKACVFAFIALCYMAFVVLVCFSPTKKGEKDEPK